MLSRRSFVFAGAALAGAAVIAKPEDQGGRYDDYFARLNQTLRSNAIDRPVLVIDLDRLDRNIDRVVESAAIAPGKTWRVVVKSLPSPQLVDYVAQRAGSQALMCFHRPFIEAMAKLRPQSDILLGKPMPVSAARHFYVNHRGDFDPASQLQWLIDTDTRLAQYLALARELGLKLRINLEIDVGLRRGGFAGPEALQGALSSIGDNPQHLEFAGFMGYDAHLMGLPGFLVQRELSQVKARYAACKDYLKSQFPQLFNEQLCFNGAGSPTFRYYEGDDLLNDISAGSCLMKPTHYDLPILQDFEASAFIASPVLKRLQGGRLPAMDGLGPLLRAWNPNQAQIYFAYGGNWLAEPASPPGLSPNFAYISSNQQGFNASDTVNIDVDDFIFLRPTQSEAVLLQFGDLVAVRGDRIEARWPVLPVGI
jgi:D-serine deaminase-like pyridoxal phosphate-dependent protein